MIEPNPPTRGCIQCSVITITKPKRLLGLTAFTATCRHENQNEQFTYEKPAYLKLVCIASLNAYFITLAFIILADYLLDPKFQPSLSTFLYKSKTLTPQVIAFPIYGLAFFHDGMHFELVRQLNGVFDGYFVKNAVFFTGGNARNLRRKMWIFTGVSFLDIIIYVSLIYHIESTKFNTWYYTAMKIFVEIYSRLIHHVNVSAHFCHLIMYNYCFRNTYYQFVKSLRYRVGMGSYNRNWIAIDELINAYKILLSNFKLFKYSNDPAVLTFFLMVTWNIGLNLFTMILIWNDAIDLSRLVVNGYLVVSHVFYLLVMTFLCDALATLDSLYSQELDCVPFATFTEEELRMIECYAAVVVNERPIITCSNILEVRKEILLSFLGNGLSYFVLALQFKFS